jgi:DNA-binding LacI/PurR family transcriptional regulator
MTTMRQPLVRMGATAARMILALGSGESLPEQRVVLSTELVVRQSTAAPRIG